MNRTKDFICSKHCHHTYNSCLAKIEENLTSLFVSIYAHRLVKCFVFLPISIPQPYVSAYTNGYYEQDKDAEVCHTFTLYINCLVIQSYVIILELPNNLGLKIHKHVVQHIIGGQSACPVRPVALAGSPVVQSSR